ncbi:MAG: glycosyltransferase family 4 protein [Patescibacteria group bacterium]
MKKLKIAQLAPLWIPVPPRTYGGIELMLSLLTEELVKNGHDVTLFASGDSVTKARLVAPTQKAILLQKKLRSPHAKIVNMLHMVKKEAASFDLIHNHFGFFMFPLALNGDMPPILTTIHRPADDDSAAAMKLFPQMRFCAISEDAKRDVEEKGIPVADVVYNGIDPDLYSFNDKPENYLLYLGRLNWEKGIVPALRVAKMAGKKIVVAGNLIGGEEWNYFMQEVQPHLNEEGVNFVGQADFKTKVNLLKNAEALLFPIDRREPFGLVMIEAMACGTPVIAYRRGSVPEVVEHGKTGFAVDTEEEMIMAINEIPSLNRRECRKAVEEKFTLKLMIERYENLYRKILNGAV